MIEEIEAKTLLSRVKYQEWFGASYNMNLYRGCCHGCIYCDSRSECYHVDQFDRVRVKKNAVQILRKELSSKRSTSVVGIGAMSDTYNPFEQKLCTTRAALGVIAESGFGVSLDTKSALVTRDIDLFQRIRDNHSAIVKLTITTASDALSRIIEPHATPSSERFAALRELARNFLRRTDDTHPALYYRFRRKHPRNHSKNRRSRREIHILHVRRYTANQSAAILF